jgi:hypothetical protein
MADRRIRRSVAADLRPLVRLIPLWAAGSAFLAVVLRWEGVPARQLLLDPVAYGGYPWYQGLVSNLGVLGWTTSTVAAAFGAWLAHLGRRGGATHLLAGGAVLSALLALDDLFQLHIVIGRAVGMPKPVIYLAGVAIVAGWAGRNSAELARTPLSLLAAAIGALTFSVLIDSAGWATTGALVAEDAAKFLGILAWALYFTETAAAVGRSLSTAPPAHPPPPAPPPDLPGHLGAGEHRTTGAGRPDPARTRNLAGGTGVDGDRRGVVVGAPVDADFRP